MGNFIDLSPPRSPSNTVNSSLWSAPFVLAGPDCSCNNHGSCSTPAGNICVCDPDWTGLSDFSSADGVQCHVSISAIRGLWAINLALLTALVIYAIPRLYVLFLHFVAKRRQGRRLGKRVTLWNNNKTLFAISIGFLLTYPFHFVVGFCRIFAPTLKIGIDPFLTICWFLVRFGFCIASSIHQPELIARMLQAQDQARSIVKRNEFMTRSVFLAMVSCSLVFMLPVLATQGQDVIIARICFVGFASSHALLYLFFSLQTRRLSRAIDTILTRIALANSNGVSDQSVMLVRDRLVHFQYSQSINTLIQFFVFFAFAVAPPLWILHDYLLPISWIGPIFLGKQAIDSLALNQNSDTIAFGSNVNSIHSDSALQPPVTDLISLQRSIEERTNVVTDDLEESVMTVHEHMPEILDTSLDWATKSVAGMNSAQFTARRLEG